MRHGKPIVTDARGERWTVMEERPTPHGFALYLGKPADVIGRGGKKVVLTKALLDYLESCRTKRGSIDLPIAKSALTSLRQQLGHNIYDDLRKMWESRLDDLANLTIEACAEKHGVTPGQVELARLKLLGRQQREDGWWRKPRAAKLLTGDQSPVEVASKLGISVGAVGRLRWKLRHEK